MQRFQGKTIYVKSEADVIKNLITTKKGEYASSHNHFYGNKIDVKSPMILALRNLILEQRRKKEAEKLAREQLLKKKTGPGLNYNNIFLVAQTMAGGSSSGLPTQHSPKDETPQPSAGLLKMIRVSQESSNSLTSGVKLTETSKHHQS